MQDYLKSTLKNLQNTLFFFLIYAFFTGLSLRLRANISKVTAYERIHSDAQLTVSRQQIRFPRF
jgi:hypothetical protein